MLRPLYILAACVCPCAYDADAGRGLYAYFSWTKGESLRERETMRYRRDNVGFSEALSRVFFLKGISKAAYE